MNDRDRAFHVWWDSGEHGWSTERRGAEYTLARDAWFAAWAELDKVVAVLHGEVADAIQLAKLRQVG